MPYDAIVVGSRLAGAATGMLLARQCLRVLVVDRTHFPSDTLSSHQLQPPGVARLHRWGLLDRLDATGTPPVRDVRFDVNGVVIAGRYPDVAGAGACTARAERCSTRCSSRRHGRPGPRFGRTPSSTSC